MADEPLVAGTREMELVSNLADRSERGGLLQKRSVIGAAHIAYPGTNSVGDDEDDIYDEDDAIDDDGNDADSSSEAALEQTGDEIIEDIKLALWHSRYIGPVVSALFVFIAYLITIHPYQKPMPGYEDIMPEDRYRLTRPVLNQRELRDLHQYTQYAETLFQMPNSYDEVKVRYYTKPMKEGSFYLPQMFYEGVTFGLGVSNPHDLEYTGQNEMKVHDLEEVLRDMNPKPTHVFRRSSRYNSTGTVEEDGIAAHFSYADLERQGQLSSDKLQPWKRVLTDVIEVARDFKQVYVTMWYPHTYGSTIDEEVREGNVNRKLLQAAGVSEELLNKAEGLLKQGSSHDSSNANDQALVSRRLKAKKGSKFEKNTGIETMNGLSRMAEREGFRGKPEVTPRSMSTGLVGTVGGTPGGALTEDMDKKYTVIVQQIEPTRTGLDQIKSKVAVWLSAINNTSPDFPPLVYEKAWTEEEKEARRRRRLQEQKDSEGPVSVQMEVSPQGL